MEENNQDLFNNHYKEYYQSYPNKQPYNAEQLRKIADEITTAKNKNYTTKTRREYYLLQIYDVVTINGEKSVIKKVKKQGDPIIYIVPEEEIYNRLKDIHINCGHGSRDKIINIIQQSCYIPRPCVEMFLKSCKTCQTKKNKSVSKIVVKPITSNCFMTRGQVDLIDFQSIADGEFRWLLNFQDHATKYVCLRPLRSKQAAEVAQELIKIFLQFGAPSVLQSDNGREFACKIIDELKLLWPQLHIVHGRPRHPQSQGSVERANQDVENMLRAWMQDNNTTAWSARCYFVQWQKNYSLHRVIGRCPFKAVFGSDPKFGVQSTNLPHYMVSKIRTEEELDTFTTELVTRQECQEQEKNLGVIIETNKDHKKLDIPKNLKLFEATDQTETGEINKNGNKSETIISGHNTLEPIQEDQTECELDSVNIICIECHGFILNTAAIFCEICKFSLHVTCVENRKICNICNTKNLIEVQQRESYEGQKRQAEQMMTVTKKMLPNIDVGDCVLINIDKVDRTPGDPPNFIAVVTDFKNGVYQVGTAGGIIKSWFNRPDMKKSSSRFITLDQLNKDTFISLREAVSLESPFKGQGYVKCLCQPSKMQCKTNRCQCFKAKVQCNSRCHKSGPCNNK